MDIKKDSVLHKLLSALYEADDYFDKEVKDCKFDACSLSYTNTVKNLRADVISLIHALNSYGVR